MSLLASESLLRVRKKIQKLNVTPSETTGLAFQVQYSPFSPNWAVSTLEIFKQSKEYES